MEIKKMPVVFLAHGSPMVALENNQMTDNMKALGKIILERFGKPKGILAISGHWFTDGTYIQSAQNPKQIYDMYGFPKELYQVRYTVQGNQELTEEVWKLLGSQVQIDDGWGIDHGSWTVLVHMFPEADIPVVQLSVNKCLSPEESFELGEMLEPLREKGYLILGSGSVVHNLYDIDPSMGAQGKAPTIRFDQFITDSVLEGSHENLKSFMHHPDSSYAVPTPDHFYPLLYCVGAAKNDPVTVFSRFYQFGSTSRTSFAFGLYPVNE